MKKLLLILFIIPVFCFAQTSPATVSFKYDNTQTNTKDSLRFIYPGAAGGLRTLGTMEFIRSLFLKKIDGATKDSTTVILPTISALQAYNGRYTIALVTDTLRGGGTPFNYVASGTDDNVVTFAATGKGSGHWVRQYNKSNPVDMRWGGLTNTNTNTQNETIVNTYLTAHPDAYIAYRGAYLRRDSIHVTNSIKIYDQSYKVEIISGQSFGKSTGGGGQHLDIVGLNQAGRLYTMPDRNLADSANTVKFDMFDRNYNVNTTTYGLGYAQYFKDRSNGNAGVFSIGTKGFGNIFGVFPALEMGVGDGAVPGLVAFKQQYYDLRDSVWHMPFKGDWLTGTAYTTLQYITASNHLYRATTTGTSGATIPSHTSGTVSDGGVSWLFIKDYSGSESSNFKLQNIFGYKSSRGLLGPNVPLTLVTQFHGDAGFINSIPLYWFDNAGKPLWTDATTLNGTDWRRTSTNGTNAFQRWETSKNYIQNSGLAWLKASRTITDNSATPNVDSLMVVTFNNASPTTITNFVGEPYQEITVQSNNTNTTIANNSNIILQLGENLALTTGMSVVFQANASGVWRQNGPALATTSNGGLWANGAQTLPPGDKTTGGNFTASFSTTGTTSITATNSNTGAAADARVRANNGTVVYEMIMRGPNFTTNANNAYSSVTGTGLLGWLMNGNQRMTLLTGGNLGIGVTAPTGVLHLKAGTATASTAPFKYTSGTLLTTAEAGAKEFLTDKEYLTITTGAARKEVALFDAAGTSGRVPYETTNGRLIDASTLTFDGTSLTTTLASATTATTQTSSDNSTKIATTAFVKAQSYFSNPMTTLGDIVYGGASGLATRLAGNITTTQKFLTQTGDGANSAAPVYTDLFGGINTWSSTNKFPGGIEAPKALGYGFRDPSTLTISSLYTGAMSTTNLWMLPDASGTIALTSSLSIHGNSTTTGTATTAVTVTIGSTMANNTYAVAITPKDLLTAVNYYISAQTTTTFTVTFVTALTGSINFDWILTP